MFQFILGQVIYVILSFNSTSPSACADILQLVLLTQRFFSIMPKKNSSVNAQGKLRKLRQYSQLEDEIAEFEDKDPGRPMSSAEEAKTFYRRLLLLLRI